MKILAIESSCDETAAGVVEDGRKVLSSVISSQVEEHKKYGGVVPEIASRRHCEDVLPVTRQALEDAGVSLKEIDAIACTGGPGLIGALLVGVNFAKGLALSAGKPLIPVHHIRGHIAANYLEYPELKPPFLCLVASGGHTCIVEVKDYTEFQVIGTTRDDAAGEAYDKAARALGFPYPGGIYIDRAAQNGDPNAFALPHPTVDGSPYDMSFSGLKTAVLNLCHKLDQQGKPLPREDIAASFQKTVCEMLCSRLFAAAEDLGESKIVIAGGVAANSGLRDSVSQIAKQKGLTCYLPPKSLCGDNGVMIGSQAYYEALQGNFAGSDFNAVPSLSVELPFAEIAPAVSRRAQ